MKRLFSLQPARPHRAVHGYVYYRWTETYIALVRWGFDQRWLGPLRTWAGNRLAATHHAKVVPADSARRIVTLDHDIELRELEHVVPYRIARDVVLEAPARIALARCACRATAEHRGERDGRCGPLEQCLYVGDPIASFVAERQDGARLITADEAVAVIDAAAGRGSVHTLWFKDAADGRMYAICNCCSCCCIGLKGRREGFQPLAASGYRAVVDAAACTGCRTCERACAFGAISMGPDGRAVVDATACMGCAACVNACAFGALAMVEAPESGVEPFPWELIDRA